MKLPPTQRGDTPGQEDFNTLRAAVKSLQPMRGNGTQTRQTPFGVSRKVTKARPQTPQAPATFYPFRIYAPTNISGLVDSVQPLVVDNGTEFQTCVIVDANTQTDLSANPPIVSVRDAWRFWAVRSGYVEMRSVYGVPGSTLRPFLTANFSIPIVPKYTDFAGSEDNTEFWTEFEYSDQIDTSAGNTIILGGNGDSNGSMTVLLWIQCFPDTSNAAPPTAELQGFTFPDSVINTITQYGFGNLNEGENPLPGGPNTIPVGIIFIKQGTNGANGATNFIYDHARNRFANGSWRGSATIDGSPYASQCSPGDLAKRLIYPGDTISLLRKNTDGDGIIDTNGIYIFTGANPEFPQADINGVPTPDVDPNFSIQFNTNAPA
jgi:hypothetical protein